MMKVRYINVQLIFFTDTMKLGIVGTGYVGTTVGTGLASKGHDITFIDVDQDKVKKINRGDLPLHDRTLEEPFEEVHEKGKLEASTDYDDLENKEAVFLTLPTPSKEDGSIDLDYLREGTRSVGKVLGRMNNPLIVVKSTVLPKTTEDVVIPALEEESGLEAGEDFRVCMNPEFLREGSALDDFLEPDRIVLGELDQESGDKLEKLYEDFDAPIIRTGLKEVEMIKYASNALLATKISFANEIGNLCKELDIDTYEVMDAVGMDHRISRDFLNSGVGFGGSCFPKDVKAIVRKAENTGVEPRILNEVLKRNENQRERFVDLAEKVHGELDGKDVGILGLSFKPRTDDIRESPAITIIGRLLEKNCNVHAHDPKAMEEMKKLYPNISYYDSVEEVVKNSDIVKILTDWPQFEELENHLDKHGKKAVEGRRMFPENENVEGICW